MLQLKIDGAIPLPTSIVARNGLEPFWGYDRAFVARGNRVYHLVSYIDYVNYKQDPGSSVVVIDTDTNTIATVLDAPCPTLDAADVSPNGDIYLSGWVYGPGATIVNKDAPGCILKIAAGQDVIDPSFKLVSTAFTGGHETAAFRHLTGHKYLVSVFHEEKNAYDAKTEKIDDWLFSDGWSLAVYDIVSKQFQELPALGYGSGGYTSTKIGDRFYILNPGKDYSTTLVQQILPDLSSTNGLSTDGWATRLFRIK